jgi:CRP/FNR family transcriptional regulator/CRP/FNR family cyclic AMP-dependent transcriptional regulator
LYIVESGSVRIHVTGSQGTDLTLAVMNAGDFFGDMSLLDGKPRSASASAVTDSSLIILDRDHFTELVRKRPDAALAVLARVTQRLRGSDQMASDLAFLDAAGRLARRLLEIAEQSGVKRQDGVLLNVRITQEELANMVGVTRESVNRNLSDFRREGLIKNEGRKIVICDPAGLRARYE